MQKASRVNGEIWVARISSSLVLARDVGLGRLAGVCGGDFSLDSKQYGGLEPEEANFFIQAGCPGQS